MMTLPNEMPPDDVRLLKILIAIVALLMLGAGGLIAYTIGHALGVYHW